MKVYSIYTTAGGLVGRVGHIDHVTCYTRPEQAKAVRAWLIKHELTGSYDSVGYRFILDKAGGIKITPLTEEN